MANFNYSPDTAHAARVYGQVEPNHLAGQRTKQLYAQLPYNGTLPLANGQFCIYSMVEGEVYPGNGPDNGYFGDEEPFLHFSEVKLYDDWRESYKDFCIKRDEVRPRMIKTFIGDMFTTDVVKGNDIEVGTVLSPNSDGVLSNEQVLDQMKWAVVELTTMPDGTPAVKVQRIK